MEIFDNLKILFLTSLPDKNWLQDVLILLIFEI